MPVVVGEGEESGVDYARDPKTKCAAKQGQDEAFGQELSNDTASRGSDCAPYGDFSIARGGCRQHQIRQVRASDQQHEQDDNGNQY